MFTKFIYSLCLGCFLLLSGCGNTAIKPTNDPLVHADAGAGHLSNDLSGDSVKAGSLANQLNQIADKASVAINAGDKQAGLLLMQQLKDLGVRVKDYSIKLLDYVKDIKSLQDDVASAKTERAALSKELADAKKAEQAHFYWVQLLGVVLIAAGFGLFFYLGNMKLSAAIGAGGAGLLVGTQFMTLVDQMIPILKWVGVGMISLGVIWIMFERWKRGSWAAALRSDPLGDLISELKGQGVLVDPTETKSTTSNSVVG